MLKICYMLELVSIFWDNSWSIILPNSFFLFLPLYSNYEYFLNPLPLSSQLCLPKSHQITIFCTPTPPCRFLWIVPKYSTFPLTMLYSRVSGTIVLSSQTKKFKWATTYSHFMDQKYHRNAKNFGKRYFFALLKPSKVLPHNISTYGK